MDRNEFFAEVCRRLGWEPTPWRLAVFSEWARLEGMPYERTYNPLATTRLGPSTPLDTSFDIGFGPGNWNAVPVRVYRDAASGVAATVETLGLSYYPNIRRCFADERGYDGAVPEFATYVGGEAYGPVMVKFMRSLPAAKPSAPPLTERVARLERIIAGNGIDAAGARLTGEAALAWLDEQEMSLFLGLALTQAEVAALRDR